jgi:hypothetical protein
MEEHRPTSYGEESAMQLGLLFDSIRRRLGEMSETQTQISTTRRELLIERERVKTTGRKVQQKRIDAGNAEADFMSHLSQFVNNYRGEVSRALLIAYDKVRQTRDELGEMEDDYLLAEGDLTGAEWTFVTRENRFYQLEIKSILSGLNSIDLACLPNPRHEISHYPLAHRLPPCPAGSLSPSEVSKLPPPPPPPHPPFVRPQDSPYTLRNAITHPLPVQAVQEYVATVEEMETMKREFDRARNKQAYSIEWDDGDEVFFPGGEDLPDSGLSTSAEEYGDMVFNISTSEVKAQQYRVEGMDAVLDASLSTRRFSDPAHLSRAMPKDLTSMRRTQTESAASSLRDDALVKEKIRAWSFTYLKDNAVQRRLYLNTLAQYGVSNPIESDWKIRAAQFWSRDSLVNGEDANVCDATPINETRCSLESRREPNATQTVVAWSPMQISLEGSLHPITQTTAGSKPLEDDCDDDKSSLQFSELSLPTVSNGDSPAANSDKLAVVDEPCKAESQHQEAGVMAQAICTCPAEYGDAAQRKDSVHGTEIDHHVSCGKYHLEARTQVPSQLPSKVGMAMDTSATHDPCSATRQEEPLGLHSPATAQPEPLRTACVHSSFDFVTRAASTSPCIQTRKPSAPNGSSDLQFLDTPDEPQSRPVLPQRRTSGNRLMEWFSSVTKRRTKSTPTIEVHHSGIRTRKQSVA